MPPELAEVREWIRKADRDRRMAELGLGESPAITDAAAFHCQQAVEKLLKAYLVFRQQPFEKIHDLEVLVEQCKRSDTTFADLVDGVEPLSPYAVRFRYPGPADPTVDEVRQALDVVGDVRRFVLERLPDEVRP